MTVRPLCGDGGFSGHSILLSPAAYLHVRMWCRAGLGIYSWLADVEFCVCAGVLRSVGAEGFYRDQSKGREEANPGMFIDGKPLLSTGLKTQNTIRAL